MESASGGMGCCSEASPPTDPRRALGASCTPPPNRRRDSASMGSTGGLPLSASRLPLARGMGSAGTSDASPPAARPREALGPSVASEKLERRARRGAKQLWQASERLVLSV
eukprot:Hpha_TRINITY_DN34393_c0_g1::TRINITY_DN34393_c0_g1_i1::g.109571::m.109571